MLGEILPLVCYEAPNRFIIRRLNFSPAAPLTGRLSDFNAMNTKRLTGIRTYLLLALLAFAVLAVQLFNQAQELSVLATSRRWLAGIGIAALAAVLLAGILAFSWSARGQNLLRKLLAWHPRKSTSIVLLKILSSLYLLGAVITLGWLVLGGYGSYFPDLAHRLPVFVLLAVGGGLLLRSAFPPSDFFLSLAYTSLILASGYRVMLFVPEITSYPFSMGWSETSRYYFASLFFSEQIYGLSIPAPVLHPSRYLLQSLPYLLPDLPLWFHRFWQVLLWLALPLAAVGLLARHLKIRPSWRWWLFVLWAFLFIYQGPIYYHLTVCLVLVLLGYDNRSFTRTAVFVLLAALWAGISRVNWIPMPGALAVTLYLLENRVGRQPLWRYLLAPAGWFALSLAAGLGSQFVYAAWSGNELAHFSTSFTSDLLWYRLLPNPTYPEGILPSILVVSLPLFLLIGERLRRMGWRLHWLRLVGLLGMLVVFFAGGLLVSVKIGGGNNLHNLDGFMFLLLVVAASLYYNRTELEEPLSGALPRPHWALMAGVVFLPVIYMLQGGGPVERVSQLAVQEGLRQVQQFVDQARQQQGEILFLSERQLLIFDTVEDVTLIPDYERTYLMEMAMARATPYLQNFYQQLADHRFTLIVSQPLNLAMKGPDSAFGEENDAWVEYVARAILCTYEPVETLREVSLQFLVPAGPGSELPAECSNTPFAPAP